MNTEFFVDLAATKLDELMPGWHDRIDPKTLDLTSAETCVMGQLGQYRVGADSKLWLAFKEKTGGATLYATTCSARVAVEAKPYWLKAISGRQPDFAETSRAVCI